jgi:hypothetical protein
LVIAPSGEQITITAADQQAVVVEVGGGPAVSASMDTKLFFRERAFCRAASQISFAPQTRPDQYDDQDACAKSIAIFSSAFVPTFWVA